MYSGKFTQNGWNQFKTEAFYQIWSKLRGCFGAAWKRRMIGVKPELDPFAVNKVETIARKKEPPDKGQEAPISNNL